MNLQANTLLILGAILLFGLFLPQLLRRFHLPFTTVLILLGSLVGPYGADAIRPDETLQFFGFLGAAFMMLLAGFEFQSIRPGHSAGNSAVILAASGGFPALAGVVLMRLAGYDWIAAFFVGVVFLSSSIMLAFSFVRNIAIEGSKLGKTLRWLVMTEDLLSALLVLVVFKTVEPHLRFPLPILLGLVLSGVIILRMFLPEVVSYFFHKTQGYDEDYEAELRLVLAVTLLVIFAFSALDVHPIIAAYLVGFALSDLPEVEVVREKLQTVAYSVFIPVFLFVVGLETDLSVLLLPGGANLFFAALVVGAIATKVIGGYVSGRWLGFGRKESLLLGVGISPKLIFSLSMAFAAVRLGIVDTTVFSAIILVSVVSTTITPVAVNFLGKRTPEPKGD